MTTTSYVISLALPYAIIADFIGMNVDYLASETNEEPFILSNQVCACYSHGQQSSRCCTTHIRHLGRRNDRPSLYIYGQFAHDYDPTDSHAFSRRRNMPETRWRALTTRTLRRKVTVFEVHGRVGSFDGRIAGFSGLSDDIPIASQCGERHELGGTIMRAHVRMRARLAMR